MHALRDQMMTCMWPSLAVWSDCDTFKITFNCSRRVARKLDLSWNTKPMMSLTEMPLLLLHFTMLTWLWGIFICPEHAFILVNHIPNLIAYENLIYRDMVLGGKHELPLKLHFRLQSVVANKVALEIHWSGHGKTTMKCWREGEFWLI